MAKLTEIPTSEVIELSRAYLSGWGGLPLPDDIATEALNRLDIALAAVRQATKERDELRRKVEELAAENTQMLKLLSDISGNHIEYYSEGECGMFAGIPLDYVSEINAHVARDVNAENTFKATDAALAEIGAKAVEACADALLSTDDISCEHEYPMMLEFAEQLRKEAGNEQ